MNILKTTAAAFMSSLIIGAASMPASATGATQTPLNTDVMIAKNVAAPIPAATDWLQPSPNDLPTPQDRTNCKARHVYSQHDTVGDPQACIMAILTIGGGITAVAP